MGRERSSSHSHYAAVGNPLDNLSRTQGYLPDYVRGTVNGLLPFVSIHVYDHVHHRVPGQVSVRLDGGNGTGYRTVDIGGNKTCGGSYHLSHLHLISLLYEGFGGSSQMLGHGNVHPLWQREYLYR